jgi:arginase
LGIRTGTVEQLKPGMVALLGIPSDEASSYLRGAALAPARIREVLHAGAMNLCAENGADLGSEARLADVGDLEPGSGDAMRRRVEAAVAAVLVRGARTLALGGDHAITYPIVRAYAARHERLNLLHLDAHPDLYDEFDGNRYSHACPFARIMEEGLAARLVQVGIRTANPHQRAQAQRFGVEVIEMRAFRPGLELAFDGPLYLSLDLDALDPACAPGVSHVEPGGLTTREAIGLIQGLNAPIAGADIVELNPLRDPSGVTAVVAAKLLKEIAARMLE